MNRLQQKLNSLQQAASKLANETIPFKKVTPEIHAKRWEICQACEHLYKVTNSCRKCGCFMEVKTWMATQRCPIKKWHATDGPLAVAEEKNVENEDNGSTR